MSLSSDSLSVTVASQTSTNNFINYCAGKILTSGKQIRTGSCNPAPMGVVPPVDLMPSSKFQFPVNGASLEANRGFTVQLNVANFAAGSSASSTVNYLSAPQQLDSSGRIVGHAQIVIEALAGFDQAEPPDPAVCAETLEAHSTHVLLPDLCILREHDEARYKRRPLCRCPRWSASWNLPNILETCHDELCTCARFPGHSRLC